MNQGEFGFSGVQLDKLFKKYSAHTTASTGVTDGSSPYDIDSLVVNNIPSGLYLVMCSISMGAKTGTVRYTITDGSGNVLWPVGSGSWTAFSNSDSKLQTEFTAVIRTTTTSTIKTRGAAVASVSNYTVYDRSLTVIRIA